MTMRASRALSIDTRPGSQPDVALAGAPKTRSRLLLAHNPKSAPDTARAHFDLQLSGHTHDERPRKKLPAMRVSGQLQIEAGTCGVGASSDCVQAAGGTRLRERRPARRAKPTPGRASASICNCPDTRMAGSFSVDARRAARACTAFSWPLERRADAGVCQSRDPEPGGRWCGSARSPGSGPGTDIHPHPPFVREAMRMRCMHAPHDEAPCPMSRRCAAPKRDWSPRPAAGSW